MLDQVKQTTVVGTAGFVVKMGGAGDEEPVETHPQPSHRSSGLKSLFIVEVIKGVIT